MSAATVAESRILRYLDALERERTPPPADTLEMITLQPGMSVIRQWEPVLFHSGGGRR
jgi:hypothetical protein